MKDTANALADAGFTVLAPDLLGGATFEDTDQALNALAETDMNVVASLVQSSVGILRRAQADPAAPIGVLGFGPGASWALWLSVRFADDVSAVATYYGSQSIPMEGSTSSYLCHWAEVDANVDDLDVADLGLSLQLAGRDFRFEHHDGTADGLAGPTLVEPRSSSGGVASDDRVSRRGPPLRVCDSTNGRRILPAGDAATTRATDDRWCHRRLRCRHGRNAT
jgi:dienelactone hydrolase